MYECSGIAGSLHSEHLQIYIFAGWRQTLSFVASQLPLCTLNCLCLLSKLSFLLSDQSEYVFHLFHLFFVPYWLNLLFPPVPSGGDSSSRSCRNVLASNTPHPSSNRRTLPMLTEENRCTTHHPLPSRATQTTKGGHTKAITTRLKRGLASV